MAAQANKSNNAKKNPAKSGGASRPGRSGRPAGLFFWLAIIAIVAVVLVLIIVKVTSSSTKQQSTTWTPVSTQVFNELTSVPNSTFNAVGDTASVTTTITAPNTLAHAPVLELPDANGVKRPTVFYYGAEYCPFCAAERWAIIVALSRFGTFSDLGNMSSAAGDVYANTPTFTFLKATYTSSYINFASVESYTNTIDAATNYYKVLQKPTAIESKTFNDYDTPTDIPGLSEAGDIPFISFDNKWLIGGAQYSPSLIDGNSRNKIASELADPNSLLTQPIIASANLLSAAICNIDGDQPSDVCTSPGVKTADATMGIKTT